jgi:MFS transporter, DHA1 family, tetracycline resistance protein
VFAKLLPILGITFIDILGFSILIPILPYYVRHFGASYVLVGVLFSTFALCQFIGGPVWGNVSDRVGRKRVLIVSQLGASIGWAMLAIAPSLPWVFAARIIEGFSGGNLSVTQAYVADRVASGDRARAFAFVGAAFSAGLVLGPLCGGVLFDRFGYRMPFLFATALQVVTLIVTIAFLPENVPAERGASASVAQIAQFLGNARVAPILVQKLTFALGLYGWFAVFALVIKATLGFGPSQTSYLFAVFGIASVVFQLTVVGRMNDRLGPRATSNIGFLAASVYFVGVAFVHDALALVAAMGLFAFALSITNATLVTLLTNAVPERVRGTVLGVGSSLESIAGILMPALSAAALDARGPAAPGGISAFFCLTALALGLAAQRRTLPAA